MPQVNPVNEEIKKRMSAYFDQDKAGQGADQRGKGYADPRSVEAKKNGRGYNYTYLYPGLQKVVQAAGRVIRTQHDEGVIYLMDDRFTRPEVLALLPAWWKVTRLFAPPDRLMSANTSTPTASRRRSSI